LLSQLRHNVLILGTNHASLVTCLSNHKNHYVGTKRAVSMKSQGSKSTYWGQILSLVLRYASIGSQIDVYLLHDGKNIRQPVATISKSACSMYSPPGCTLPPLNGVPMPCHVEVPIGKVFIKEELVGNW
jgi:hypothetical protein